ncbi:hypothetical protein CBR_g1071 [Chara braunii]|uniref:Ppx/GppA phosphatase N-terminal domain-containing protein n=1 Tax=Chara braunii TaxID=69332 RepID=A0A388KD21_CHABU|nr:hypothetical protein CBR_g1071 [Chara braunii]|eukprot:GBG67952.1 hypothetical protein CBR_g1071 [Chara braunii]
MAATAGAVTCARGAAFDEILAAVDCGSNCTRLLVCHVEQPGKLSQDGGMRLTRFTSMGEGLGDGGGELTPDALRRTVDVLREYRAVVDGKVHGQGIDGGERPPRTMRVRMRAVATSAARRAKNCDSFLAAAQAALGSVRPDVISGEEEARLSFLGAVSGLDPAMGPFLVVDMGGGSTELAFGPAPGPETCPGSETGPEPGPTVSGSGSNCCDNGVTIQAAVQDRDPGPIAHSSVRPESADSEEVGRSRSTGFPDDAVAGPEDGPEPVPGSTVWSHRGSGNGWDPHSGPRVIESVEIGTVRLTERFLKSDPPTAEELRACHVAALGCFREVLKRRPVFAQARTIIGVAGTASTLAAMGMEMVTYDRTRVHLSKLTRGTVRRVFDQIKGIPTADRVGIPGLEKGREDVIVAGCVIVLALMEALGSDTWLASDCDLLDGIVLDLLRRDRQ